MDKEGEMATTREGKEKVEEIVPHRLSTLADIHLLSNCSSYQSHHDQIDGVPIQFGQEADVGAAEHPHEFHYCKRRVRRPVFG